MTKGSRARHSPRSPRCSRLLDEYNREPRPRSAVDDTAGPISRLAIGLFGRRRSSRVFQCDLQEGIERQVTAGTPAWLAAPSARASVFAEHYRTWFKRVSRLVLASATLAAVALAAGVAAGAESAVWAALEFVFLMLALVAFLVIRRFGFHGHWLSYRVLAERLRSARYIAPDRARLPRSGSTAGRLGRGALGGVADARLRRGLGSRASQGAGTSTANSRVQTAASRQLGRGQIEYHELAEE